jgi:hypothetical protein
MPFIKKKSFRNNKVKVKKEAIATHKEKRHTFFQTKTIKLISNDFQF